MVFYSNLLNTRYLCEYIVKKIIEYSKLSQNRSYNCYSGVNRSASFEYDTVNDIYRTFVVVIYD